MNHEAQETGGTAPEPTTGQPEELPSGQPSGTMQPDAVMVILSYIGLFALIPFLTVKDNDFVRWHAKQGLTFTAVLTVLFPVLFVATVIMAFVPFIGGIIATLLSLVMTLGGLGCFVLCILATVKGLGGERWPIPVIGDLAKRW